MHTLRVSSLLPPRESCPKLGSAQMAANAFAHWPISPAPGLHFLKKKYLTRRKCPQKANWQHMAPENSLKIEHRVGRGCMPTTPALHHEGWRRKREAKVSQGYRSRETISLTMHLPSTPHVFQVRHTPSTVHHLS